jgi:hypothetical protein
MEQVLVPFPPGYRCSDGVRSLNAPLEAVYRQSAAGEILLKLKAKVAY